MYKANHTLLGVALLATVACASNRAAHLEPSQRSPATQAEIKVDRGMFKETGNAQLAIELEHLPPPSELGDEYTTFVVWLTPKGTEQPQNIGELDYDPASREGTLDVLTPYEQFTVAITAEPMGHPIKKSETEVASGKVDLRRYQR